MSVPANLRLRQSIGIVVKDDTVEFFKANTSSSILLKMRFQNIVELLENFDGVNTIHKISERYEGLPTEQLKKLASFLKRFKNADEFIWCQEEPENMGAWSFVEKYINWTLDSIGAKSKTVQYVGRKPSASTATGYLKKHVQQQDEIISKVLL